MTNQQHEKIGQLMLWLSIQVEGLYLTKLLKLLYLVDEYAVKRAGVPVTWLRYRVWEKGPVPPLIYNELKKEAETSFANYVRVECESPDWSDQQVRRIVPNGQLDQTVFSELEQQTVAEIIQNYGHLNGKALVQLLHEEGTLWHQLFVKHKLEERFATTGVSTTNYEIPLTHLIAHDEAKLNRYQTMEEFIAFDTAF